MEVAGSIVGIFIFFRVVMDMRETLNTGYLSDNRYFYDSIHVQLDAFKTDSGLVIYRPDKDALCWGAPILCSPEPKAKLMLRKANKIQDGFKVDG